MHEQLCLAFLSTYFSCSSFRTTVQSANFTTRHVTVSGPLDYLMGFTVSIKPSSISPCMQLLMLFLMMCSVTVLPTSCLVNIRHHSFTAPPISHFSSLSLALSFSGPHLFCFPLLSAIFFIYSPYCSTYGRTGGPSLHSTAARK